MLFNSYIFWIFFSAVIVLYRIGSHRWQNRMLLVASYVFYGSWDWRFLGLIFISTLINYLAAKGIARWDEARRKKAFCLLSVCVSLGLLGVFKYYGFFVGEMVTLLDNLGLNVSLSSLKIVLPVGISFYTFQTMSYTIDVYRGVTRPTHDFLDFALYVAFFPQLVAGPIERSTRLMPQITNPRPRRSEDFSQGLYLVLLGLFKKIIIADNMSVIVNAIFSEDVSRLSGTECLVGIYAFAFQIYGDFSGYSSIARGLAKWMGFDLMTNFRMPYFSRTPGEFWSRWHISLSTWLRDYLYIPLGGSRGGKIKMYRNLMLTMLLGGLWHGAAWTFVAWGFFHGLILWLYRPFEKKSGPSDEKRPMVNWRSVVGIFVMFNLICFSWLLFRAESMGHAWEMSVKIVTDFQFTELSTYSIAMIAFLVTPLLAFEYWLDRKGPKGLFHLTTLRWPVRACVYSYITVMLLIFQPMVTSAFIYFQF